MTGTSHIWPPDDWEEYCNALFRERHGATGYVRVPDRDRGDLGMEGYTIDDTGLIYQCYVTEATEVRMRYEKQRDKITKDLGKLVAKADRVAALLGENIMSFWALVVPAYDSKNLITFARTKELQIRKHNLTFLADNFKIVVLTEADFAAERAAIDQFGIGTVPPSVAMTDYELARSIEDLMTAEPRQVQAMDEKLTRAGVGDVSGLRERLLRQAVVGDNIREHLRVDFPATSERVLTQLEIEENAVITERDFKQLHVGSVISVRERLSGRFAEHVPALGAGESDRLAHGQVGRWLLECPLDFPEANV